jgi:hypothetical protein
VDRSLDNMNRSRSHALCRDDAMRAKNPRPMRLAGKDRLPDAGCQAVSLQKRLTRFIDTRIR